MKDMQQQNPKPLCSANAADQESKEKDVKIARPTEELNASNTHQNRSPPSHVPMINGGEERVKQAANSTQKNLRKNLRKMTKPLFSTRAIVERIMLMQEKVNAKVYLDIDTLGPDNRDPAAFYARRSEILNKAHGGLHDVLKREQSLAAYLMPYRGFGSLSTSHVPAVPDLHNGGVRSTGRPVDPRADRPAPLRDPRRPFRPPSARDLQEIRYTPPTPVLHFGQPTASDVQQSEGGAGGESVSVQPSGEAAVLLEKGKDAEEGSTQNTDEKKTQTSKVEQGANDCQARVQGSDSEEEEERSGDGMLYEKWRRYDPKKRRTDGGDNSDQVNRSQSLSPVPAQAASLSRGSPLQTPVEQQKSGAFLQQENDTSRTPALPSGQATASAGNACVVSAPESKA